MRPLATDTPATARSTPGFVVKLAACALLQRASLAVGQIADRPALLLRQNRFAKKGFCS